MRTVKRSLCFIISFALILSCIGAGPAKERKVYAEDGTGAYNICVREWEGVVFTSEPNEDDWQEKSVDESGTDIYLYKSEEDWDKRQLKVSDLAMYYASLDIVFGLQYDGELNDGDIDITAELRNDGGVVASQKVTDLSKGKKVISFSLDSLGAECINDVVLVVNTTLSDYRFEIGAAPKLKYSGSGEDYLDVQIDYCSLDSYFDDWNKKYVADVCDIEMAQYHLADIFKNYKGVNFSFYVAGVEESDIDLYLYLRISSSEKISDTDHPKFDVDECRLGGETPIKVIDGYNNIKVEFDPESEYCFDNFFDFKMNFSSETEFSGLLIAKTEAALIEGIVGSGDEGSEGDSDSGWTSGYVPSPVLGTFDWPETVYDASGNVTISKANFPDAAFRMYVSSTYDTDKNGGLSESEISAATEMTLSSAVQDVMGIQIFTELTYLDMHNVVIDDMNILNNNRKLEKLWFFYSRAPYMNLRCLPNLKAIKGHGAKYGPDPYESVTGNFIEGDHTVVIMDYLLDCKGWEEVEGESGEAFLWLELPNFCLKDDLDVESVCWGIVENEHGSKGGFWRLENNDQILRASLDILTGSKVHVYNQICVEGAYTTDEIKAKVVTGDDLGAKVTIRKINHENEDTLGEIISGNEFDLGTITPRVETQMFQYYQVDYTQFVGVENTKYCAGIFNHVTESEEPLDNGVATILPCGVDWWSSEDGGPTFMKDLHTILYYYNGFYETKSPEGYDINEYSRDWIGYHFDHFTSTEELKELPSELSERYESLEAMENEIVDSFENLECSGSITYDADLWNFVPELGWQKINPSDFPKEGIEVFVPFPEGTDKNSEFKIAHVFTHDCNGYKAGEIEYPEVTVVDGGLRFIVKGFSPIVIAGGSLSDGSGTGAGSGSGTDSGTGSGSGSGAGTFVPGGSGSAVDSGSVADAEEKTEFEDRADNAAKNDDDSKSPENTGTIETTVVTKKDGTEVTTTKMVEADGTTVTVTTKTNAEGTKADTKATVTTKVVDGKAVISGDIIERIKEAGGKDVEISLKVKDEKGKVKFNISANAKTLVPKKSVKVYTVGKDGALVMLNSEKYKVNADGSLTLDLPKGTYKVVSTTESKAIYEEVKKTVSLTSKSESVKAGEKIKLELNPNLDMRNVASVEYSAPEGSNVTVSKKGVVKAKSAGTATVTVKVTLKNGKTISLKNKVKVK